MLFNNFEELVHNLVGWIGPIHEKKIIMRNACILKMHPIILDVVESYDLRDPYVIEYVDVLVGMLTVAMLGVPVLNRPHEGHELAWNDPVEVAVLDTLVILILFHVECPEVVPSKAHGVLKAL